MTAAVIVEMTIMALENPVGVAMMDYYLTGTETSNESPARKMSLFFA